MKRILTVLLLACTINLFGASYIRDEKGKSVNIAFGTYDDFWGFSVIVLNKTGRNIKAESYQLGKDVPLLYTCYKGETRRVHHVTGCIKLENCTIYDSQLSDCMDNVITINEDGSVWLDYHSNYLQEEFYDGLQPGSSESCLKSDTFSSLFCVYWQKEDDEGNRVNNSDLKRIFMLDTVWESLAAIGKDILG